MGRIAAVGLVVAVIISACGGASGPRSPLDEGRSIYGNVCSACHGSRGDGGTGPSLRDVIATFPSCSDHIEWVTLGSKRWKDVHGDTYGAPGKRVEGGMPSHEASLEPEEIARVVAFERITYGGGTEDEVVADCGVEESSTTP
jgi:cytochrome c2